jgi:hypothetical protein
MKDARDYRCSVCGASNCKLWREYQTFLDHQRLFCAPCGARDQTKSIEGIDANGRRSDPDGSRTDTIGWLVPAVPTSDGDTFWGYTSVPEDRCEWWRALPTQPPK